MPDIEKHGISPIIPHQLSNFTALLADSSLTADDRHNLALWRSNIFIMSMHRSMVELHRHLLTLCQAHMLMLLAIIFHGANAFYRGDYPEATALFSALQRVLKHGSQKQRLICCSELRSMRAVQMRRINMACLKLKYQSGCRPSGIGLFSGLFSCLSPRHLRRVDSGVGAPYLLVPL